MKIINNNSKLNPTTHKKDHIPVSSWIYLQVKRMVQYIQINQCDITHQKKKRKKKKKHMMISVDAGKAFVKIQHPFMMKNLTKVVWGAHLNIVKAFYDTHTQSE